MDSVVGNCWGNVNLVAAPLFHAAALNIFTLPSLARGGTTLIRRNFDPDQTLRDLAEFRVDKFFAVPSMFAALTRVPGFADADLAELRTAIVAGAPVPPRLVLDYADRGVLLQQGWGLTVITEPEVRGQVCVRGANVTPGYWRNREATEAVIDTDGWFHSGDSGYLDSDGCLFIVDRLTSGPAARGRLDPP